VLRTACAQAVAWQRQGLPALRMGVNVSALQLRAVDFPAMVRDILRETGLAPSQLQLELTETMLMQDADASVVALQELRALGVETALDDFGTGYSSLSYLKRFPLDVVKIDKAFVQDVTAAPEDASITRAIVTMAHALGLKSVAEGVETEGQLALLLAHGCDRLQGYYFCPPIGADAFVELLRGGRKLNVDALRMTGRKRRLLIVDDEPNILAAIRRLLRREGYEILTATSAASGLEMLGKAEVDVIVSDQRMPGMTGVEFLRRAKQLCPDTVRIVLSGFTELSSITDAINEGAIYKFLAKPWDDDTLRQHVAEAFRHKEQSDEKRKLSSEVQSANRELAEVNVALQNVLERQRLTILHDATTLDMSRNVIDEIGQPVIGIGPEGTIVLSNARAERDLALNGKPHGALASGLLPAALLDMLATPDRTTREVQVCGRSYRATHRKVAGTDHPAGSLLLLVAEQA
jgi:EAL domain-containing protein (putative c-di-GMP-specific phosphodiesterase class I)/CheY-like chemotaxis protein